MAMTGGIGYEIDQLTELGVPELMRRQSVDPQLKYALALQQATKLVEAAARERDMAQQMPTPANVVGQMETSLAKRLAPGVQMQGQRSMQMQNRAAMGLPGQAAPNLARMAGGGIVGYQEGGDVEGKSTQAPMMGNENQRRAPYLDPALEKFLIELEALNAQKDAAFPQEKDLFDQKIQDLIDTTSPRVKRLASDSAFGLPKKSGMAMGGAIKGYASGGEIKAYLASMGRDIADFTEAQLDAIGQMLDSQVARGQNDTLRQVGRGAMGLLRDKMPSMPENAGATSEAARQFNRETMQARNERDISPSLTDQLNAAQRRINAENDASMQDVMTSPDNKMGIANLVNAARTAGGDRVSMQDVMTSPDSGMGIANILGGVRDFISERDPRNSTMGQVLSDAIKEDISAIPGNISDFIDESGLGDLDYDAMARAVLPRATDVALESDDPSLGRYLGAFVNDLRTAPGRLVEGISESDFISDLQEGYRGEEGAATTAATATPTPAPLTEAEKFRRDAPAGLVSAIDANEGEQAALRAMFPNAPEMTAEQRVEERARAARGGGDRPTRRGAGLAGLLDKIGGTQGLLNVAETLGRGAGASKGFEAAKIVEESARARAAQQARQDQLDKLREQLTVEREKIGATKATAAARAEAQLRAELVKGLSDYEGTTAYQLAVQNRIDAGETPEEAAKNVITLKRNQLLRDLTAGGVGGMGGLDTQPGLSTEQKASLEAFLAS